MINLSLENDFSAVAAVTGIVTNRTSNLYASGKDELTLLSSIKVKISKTDVLSLTSFLNSFGNDVNSVYKFSVKSVSVNSIKEFRSSSMSEIEQFISLDATERSNLGDCKSFDVEFMARRNLSHMTINRTT